MLRSLAQVCRVLERNAMGTMCAGILPSGKLVCLQSVALRYISEEQINADGSTVAELFEQNMAKASRRRPDGASTSGPPRLLTTRREALHLYREIMRYSNLFVWKDDKGVPWRDTLR